MRASRRREGTEGAEGTRGSEARKKWRCAGNENWELGMRTEQEQGISLGRLGERCGVPGLE